MRHPEPDGSLWRMAGDSGPASSAEREAYRIRLSSLLPGLEQRNILRRASTSPDLARYTPRYTR
jgi:hypothetical protein